MTATRGTGMALAPPPRRARDRRRRRTRAVRRGNRASTSPALPAPAPRDVTYDGETARVGASYLARRGKLWVLQVAGDPVALGYQHARLASPLHGRGRRSHAGTLFLHRPVALAPCDRGRDRPRPLPSARPCLPADRRAEIYGESVGYADPYTFVFPTYQRLVYLHSLYDIALAFEHSPLLACTAFVASGPATASGHTIVGRNFDFDVDPWFDDDKVVEIVAADGRIPFVSVAWPGMTGVVTGMNAEGIWVNVNGGRAGELDSGGVPVVFTTRSVLEGARSIDDAIAIIGRDAPMASHILLLADGKTGESAVVERAPGRALGIVRDPTTTVLANHYRTAPLNADPKDARVRELTTTIARDVRMHELVTRDRGRIDPRTAAAILRDRAGSGGATLPLGNRNALDAVVSTHSVVADLTARTLWVSEGRTRSAATCGSTCRRASARAKRRRRARPRTTSRRIQRSRTARGRASSSARVSGTKPASPPARTASPQRSISTGARPRSVPTITWRGAGSPKRRSTSATTRPFTPPGNACWRSRPRVRPPPPKRGRALRQRPD